MRKLILLFSLSLFLAGCATTQENYQSVTLTASQSNVVAQDIAQTLKEKYNAGTTFNVQTQDTIFFRSLERALRLQGIGVSNSVPTNHNLSYQIDNLNPTQFYVRTKVDAWDYAKLWIMQNNQVIPLSAASEGVRYNVN